MQDSDSLLDSLLDYENGEEELIDEDEEEDEKKEMEPQRIMSSGRRGPASPSKKPASGSKHGSKLPASGSKLPASSSKSASKLSDLIRASQFKFAKQVSLDSTLQKNKIRDALDVEQTEFDDRLRKLTKEYTVAVKDYDATRSDTSLWVPMNTARTAILKLALKTREGSPALVKEAQRLETVDREIQGLQQAVRSDHYPSYFRRALRYLGKQARAWYHWRPSSSSKTRSDRNDSLQMISVLSHQFEEQWRSLSPKLKLHFYDTSDKAFEKRLEEETKRAAKRLRERLDEQTQTMARLHELELQRQSLERSLSTLEHTLQKKRVEMKQVAKRQFAEYIFEEFHQLQMHAVHLTANSKSKCDDDVKTLSPYQKLAPALMDPKKHLVQTGLVVGYQPGSGKTLIAVETCKKYVLAVAPDEIAEPIFILLPEDNLIANWIGEFRKWCLPADGWSIRTSSSAAATGSFASAAANAVKIEELDDDDLPIAMGKEKERQGGARPRKQGQAIEDMKEESHTGSLILSHGKRSRLIVLHNLLYVLPPKYRSKMSFKATEFVLPTWTTVASHPAYRSLSAHERDLLAKQETKVMADWKKKQDSIALPVGSLVISDEAHNLVDANTLIKQSPQSRVALAWANILRACYALTHKLPMTASFEEPDNLTLTFKLLNLLQVDAKEAVMFEGFWRPALNVATPDAESKQLKELYATLTRLENEYILHARAEAMKKSKDGWVSQLLDHYGGRLLFATLDNDPTVAPQYQKCSECVSVWTGKHTTPVTELPLELQRKLVPATRLPADWDERLILVPLSKSQEKFMDAKVKEEMKNGKTVDQLDYSNATSKVSSMQSFGMYFCSYSCFPLFPHFLADLRAHMRKLLIGTRFYTGEPNPKWDTIAWLLRTHPLNKFFVYFSAKDPLLVKNTEKYLKAQSFDVWTMTKTYDTLFKGSKGSVDEKVNRFYQTAKPLARALVFMVLQKDFDRFAKANAGAELKLFMFALWNHPKNNRGEYFRVFVGDRKTAVGVSLNNTEITIIVDEPINKTQEEQPRGRTKRLCSMKDRPLQEWNKMKLFQLVSIPGAWKTSSKKTNEQYLLAKRWARTDSTRQDWIAISGDCMLFQHYNQVPYCYISTGFFGARDLMNEGQALQTWPHDAWCSSAGGVVLTFAGSNKVLRLPNVEPDQFSEVATIYEPQQQLEGLCLGAAIEVLPSPTVIDAIYWALASVPEPLDEDVGEDEEASSIHLFAFLRSLQRLDATTATPKLVQELSRLWIDDWNAGDRRLYAQILAQRLSKHNEIKTMALQFSEYSTQQQALHRVEKTLARLKKQLRLEHEASSE